MTNNKLNSSVYKRKILTALKVSIDQMKQIKKGKMKDIPAEELLKEL